VGIAELSGARAFAKTAVSLFHLRDSWPLREPHTITLKHTRAPPALTHTQIASRVGSVREVVSRAFSRLQAGGLIAIDGRQVRIPDEQALAEYVDA
jgi:CRP-like cAMP-binding protein